MIKQVLIWVNRLKMSKVKIEDNFKVFIQIITKRANSQWSLRSIAKYIWQLLRKFTQITITHIYKEANTVAD